MKMRLFVTALILIAITYTTLNFTRIGLESPEYTVVQQDDDFEIREYQSFFVAATAMDNPDPMEGNSFMRLFGYISGENEDGEKIAMTTPVLRTEASGTQQMGFVVPQNVVDGGIPASTGEKVDIVNISGGRFAAYRFSGAWDEERFDAAKHQLLAWTATQGLQVLGSPMLANYDPPITPSFLKRNEVLVRIQ